MFSTPLFDYLFSHFLIRFPSLFIDLFFVINLYLIFLCSLFLFLLYLLLIIFFTFHPTPTQGFKSKLAFKFSVFYVGIFFFLYMLPIICQQYRPSSHNLFMNLLITRSRIFLFEPLHSNTLLHLCSILYLSELLYYFAIFLCFFFVFLLYN